MPTTACPAEEPKGSGGDLCWRRYYVWRLRALSQLQQTLFFVRGDYFRYFPALSNRGVEVLSELRWGNSRSPEYGGDDDPDDGYCNPAGVGTALGFHLRVRQIQRTPCPQPHSNDTSTPGDKVVKHHANVSVQSGNSIGGKADAEGDASSVKRVAE